LTISESCHVGGADVEQRSLPTRFQQGVCSKSDNQQISFLRSP